MTFSTVVAFCWLSIFAKNEPNNIDISCIMQDILMKFSLQVDYKVRSTIKLKKIWHLAYLIELSKVQKLAILKICYVHILVNIKTSKFHFALLYTPIY